MAQSNLEANQINLQEEENRSLICDMEHSEWYKDVIYYLHNIRCLDSLSKDEKRILKLHSIKYIIIVGKLWWRNGEGVILKCVDQDQAQNLLEEMHSGVCGGHYMEKTTAHKIMRAGFWWPTIFNDAHQLVKRCDDCQRFSSKLKFLGNLPLKPIVVQSPFQ
jgi:hypothetical protein